MSGAHSLLQTAARVLEARYRTLQASFVDEEGNRYHARLVWPGVVIVTDVDDGEELARSLPGKPTNWGPASPLKPVA